MSVLSLKPPSLVESLEEALTKGDTLGHYLLDKKPTYADIEAALKSVESQDATSWKQLLVDNCAIHELPTHELISFIGFIVDLLDIEELIELEACHGMFSYLLGDVCPQTMKINAIDSNPSLYSNTYCVVVERTIPDQILKLLHAKTNNQLPCTMAVQLWPKAGDDACLRSLMQKEVVTALILIGDPNGQSGVTSSFDDFAKNKNYRKFQLPVKQMCFLDTRKYATAVAEDQGRSQVTMYLNSNIYPGFSEAGFLAAFGSESFLKHYPPNITDKLVLQDYVTDGRIPPWIASKRGDDHDKVLETVVTVMKNPFIFDGRIPLIIENMEQLEYWSVQCSKLQHPMIDDSQFIEWYKQHTSLPELGLAYYRQTYGMSKHVTTIKQAEQWLWVHFSQKVAPMGWDSSPLALRTRFEQLWAIAQEERNIKCMAHEAPQLSPIPAGLANSSPIPPISFGALSSRNYSPALVPAGAINYTPIPSIPDAHLQFNSIMSNLIDSYTQRHQLD